MFALLSASCAKSFNRASVHELPSHARAVYAKIGRNGDDENRADALGDADGDEPVEDGDEAMPLTVDEGEDDGATSDALLAPGDGDCGGMANEPCDSDTSTLLCSTNSRSGPASYCMRTSLADKTSPYSTTSPNLAARGSARTAGATHCTLVAMQQRLIGFLLTSDGYR